jgi:hypothetical protein
MLRRRLLRVVVGAAWLEVLVVLVVAGYVAGALAAGTFASPADVPASVWAGVPCAVLLCYLAGSLPALLQAQNLVRAMLIWWFLLFPLLMSILFLGWPSRYAPWRVFTPLGLFVGEGGVERQWAGAALVWLPITLALLVLAAVEGVRSARGQSPAPV